MLLRNEANCLKNQEIEDLSYTKIQRAMELAKENNLKVLLGFLYHDLSHNFYFFNHLKSSYRAILNNLSSM